MLMLIYLCLEQLDSSLEQLNTSKMVTCCSHAEAGKMVLCKLYKDA